MRGGHGLGLRRSTFPQVDAEHQQHPDRQELALPVLEALVPELRINQRVGDGLWRLMMLERLLVDPARAPARCSQKEARNSVTRAMLRECE
jgi:hypothetical protein